MTYVAIINTPGYMPDSDEPAPTFDDARLAWEYLAEERQRQEDDYPDWNDGEYSETFYDLTCIAKEYRPDATAEWLITWGVEDDGTGVVRGNTPGYEGTHDLGKVYEVQKI